MAKKTTTVQPSNTASSKRRSRLPRSVRKHIRLLKSEGREDEAAAQHKAAVESKRRSEEG